MQKQPKLEVFEEVKLGELFEIILRRKKGILLCLFIALFISYLVNYHLLDPIYEAKATLMVNPTSEQPLQGWGDSNLEGLVKGLTNLPPMNVSTYVGQLKNDNILAAVSQNLELEAKGYTLREIDKMINIQILKDTNLIEIRVTNTDPNLAAAIANNLGEEFLQFISMGYKERLLKAEEVLKVQAQSLEKDMIEAHKTLNTFRNQPPTIPVLEAELRSRMAQEGSRMGEDGVLGGVEELRAQLTEKQSEQNRLIAEVQRLERIHKFLTEQLIQTQILNSLEIGKTNIITIANANVPSEPVEPRKELNMALTTVVTAVLAIAISLLSKFYNNKISDEEEVNKYMDFKVIGRIPKITPKPGSKIQEDLITKMDFRSNIGEAFRTLRTNLYFTNKETSLRKLMITSTGPTEGKSTLLANLGITIAQSGKKVLLIDADLRKPRLHDLFEFAKAPGLTQILRQERTLAEVVHSTEIENLHLITCGSIPNNPSELIASDKFDEFLNSLEGYDMILMDCPPTVTVTDSSILAQKVDGVIVVLAMNKVKISMAKRTKEQLGRSGANVVGVILNMVELEGDEYYYYSY